MDADTVVPADCFRDAAREFGEDQGAEVGVLQHESGQSSFLKYKSTHPNPTTDVLQVAHHYFENAIAFFTRRINKCISMMCANGEVAPFVGHNAFLRWSALQDAALGGGDINSSSSASTPNSGSEPGEGGNRAQVKIWSEDNVSEDFDMALRLLRQGYIVRFVLFILELDPSH